MRRAHRMCRRISRADKYIGCCHHTSLPRGGQAGCDLQFMGPALVRTAGFTRSSFAKVAGGHSISNFRGVGELRTTVDGGLDDRRCKAGLDPMLIFEN